MAETQNLFLGLRERFIHNELTLLCDKGVSSLCISVRLFGFSLRFQVSTETFCSTGGDDSTEFQGLHDE